MNEVLAERIAKR
jgi:hypothetical protein